MQPGCLLKRDGLQAQHLAGFLVKTLAGESLNSIFAGIEKIVARPQCTSCALRVMQGLKAYNTEAEWNHLDELGHRHHRRQWRRKHWGYLKH